jgi:hypothetical protein
VSVAPCPSARFCRTPRLRSGGMTVYALSDVNDRDTYRATVRLRDVQVPEKNDSSFDALIRFMPPGWLSIKPFSDSNQTVTVIPAGNVHEITGLEKWAPPQE